MAYMAGQSGGYGMLQFTKRDLYNYVHIQRLSQINDGDAAATISYLEGKANADIMSVARYTKPLEGRLGSLFWADGQMMADYKLFGDVVAFDATYRSNKYKKPLVVFSGSNHNKQTAIFGFALLEDEEVRTYRWVLLNLVDIMDNKKPSVVVTDGDKAMRAAIDDVLPSARHRLCGWHLEKNCVMQVKEPDFRKVFKKEMYANLDVLVFEDHWTTTVQSLGLMNNSWVKSTYELRHSWATTYLQGTFCTGYRTTSRCEGINAFVKGFLKSTNSLLELVHSLDRVVKIYTGSVFKEVRKQIKAVGGLLFLGKDTISTTSVYKFSSTANRRSVRRVLYDPTEPKIECDCHMWNSEGIPCTHIFSVMKYEGLEEISPSLILRRAMSVVAKLASEDAAKFTLARDVIASLAQKLHGQTGNTVDHHAAVSQKEVVKEPSFARTKGAPKHGRETATAAQDEPGGKRRCCSSCGKPGHTKRTCSSQREAVVGESGLDIRRGSEWYIPSPVESNVTQSCLPRLNPGGGGGGNFFLGGQHIQQFFAAPTCSTQHSGLASEPPATNASPERAAAFTPSHLNVPRSDAFLQWVLENVNRNSSNANRSGNRLP
ncbi:hypothetical protein AHAS_Ahas17G0116500 [Arachis hypogaea]